MILSLQTGSRGRVGEPSWLRVAKLSTNLEDNLSRAYANFEEQKVLESSIIIINYCIIIIIIMNVYYNYIIIAYYNYYISNKYLIEECGKEENMEVTGAVTISCLKIRLKTFLSKVTFAPSHHC